MEATHGRSVCNGMLRWALSTVQRNLGGIGSLASTPRCALSPHNSYVFYLRILCRLYSTITLHNIGHPIHASDGTDELTYEAKPSTSATSQHGHDEISATQGNTFVSSRPSGLETDEPAFVLLEDTATLALSQATRVQERPQKHRSYSDFALATLRSFLSSENLSSASPTVLTARYITNLYLSLHEPHRLGPTRLTSLISLFGTLSLYAHHGPQVFAKVAHAEQEGRLTTEHRLIRHDEGMRRHLHGFASKMDKSSFKPQWGFVLRLVKDKMAKAESDGGWKGHETDAYWLMRARLGLAKVKGVELDACEDSPSFSFLAPCAFGVGFLCFLLSLVSTRAHSLSCPRAIPR